jgi:hypothetical protein
MHPKNRVVISYPPKVVTALDAIKWPSKKTANRPLERSSVLLARGQIKASIIWGVPGNGSGSR